MASCARFGGPTRVAGASEVAVPARFGALETRNPAFAAKVEQLASIARQDISVLLLGESGTGKEFVAAEIHARSPREKHPFIAVNCGAIPQTLIESELFGHTRGAFSGADQPRPGAFLAANRGTLFLDEIGDAPLSVQVSLLRALETRRIKPVGADREQSVDVRLIAATSRDLRALVREERFRADLYYRLDQVTLRLPPLRERPEDIPTLAQGILKDLDPLAELSPEALEILEHHPFHGNIRELKNALYRAVTLSPPGRRIPASAVFFDSEVMATDRPHAMTAPGYEVGIQFPLAIVQLAHTAFRDGKIPPREQDQNKYDHRTRVRAALLYLKTQYPLETWPRALVTQYQRVFGERWAVSEDGRGLRALMRAVGLDVQSEEARERVRRVLG